MSNKLNINEYVSKVLLIGDAGCGKSALVNRYINGDYYDNYYNTIGVDFKIKSFNINGKNIKMHIWDTAGQEKFKSLIASYYRNSDIIILVFDLTNIMSFNHIDAWYSDIEYLCKNDKVFLYLVGTKADTNENKHMVSENAIKEKCNEYNMKYFKTSSKKNYNINELFNDIVKEIYEISKIKDSENTVNISESTESQNINVQNTCFNCNII